LTWTYHLSCCSSISCTMFFFVPILFWLLRFCFYPSVISLPSALNSPFL
jgi:hypothetical protein